MEVFICSVDFCTIIQRCDGRLKNADMASQNIRQFSLDFLPFCIKVFSVIVAWHKADTVCVEDCGMRLDRLCLQRISHDVVAVQMFLQNHK